MKLNGKGFSQTARSVGLPSGNTEWLVKERVGLRRWLSRKGYWYRCQEQDLGHVAEKQVTVWRGLGLQGTGAFFGMDRPFLKGGGDWIESAVRRIEADGWMAVVMILNFDGTFYENGSQQDFPNYY